MSRHRFVSATAMAALLMLGGCAKNPTEGQLWGTGAGACPGAIAGTIGGAAGAGAVTSILKFASYGSVVGYYAGGAVGYFVSDRYDVETRRQWTAATVEAASRAAPGASVSWASANHRGQVTRLGAVEGQPQCVTLRQEASDRDGANPYVRQVIACPSDEVQWMVFDPSSFPQPSEDGTSLQVNAALPDGKTVEVHPGPCRDVTDLHATQ